MKTIDKNHTSQMSFNNKSNTPYRDSRETLLNSKSVVLGMQQTPHEQPKYSSMFGRDKSIGHLGYQSNGQNQASILPVSRCVFYKKGHTINPKGYFIVEIASETSTLYITAFSVLNSESHVIQFHNEHATGILQRFGSNFNLMAVCLAFSGEKLILRNP